MANVQTEQFVPWQSSVNAQLPYKSVQLSGVTPPWEHTFPNNAPPFTGAFFLNTAEEPYVRYERLIAGGPGALNTEATWLLHGSDLDGNSFRLHEYLKYDPVTDRIVASKSLVTTLSSLFFGEQHKMSSAGEDVIFTNLSSGIHWSPLWQGIKDQEDPANQGMDGIIDPVSRKYTSILFPFTGSIIPKQPVATPTPIDAVGSYTLTLNLAVFGTTIIVDEPVVEGDTIRYRVWNQVSGKEVYTQKRVGEITQAAPFTWWFTHPLMGVKGVPTSERFTITPASVDGVAGEERTLLVRAVEGEETKPWRIGYARTFIEEDIITSSKLGATEYAYSEKSDLLTLHLHDEQVLCDEDGGLIYFDYYTDAEIAAQNSITFISIEEVPNGKGGGDLHYVISFNKPFFFDINVKMDVASVVGGTSTRSLGFGQTSIFEKSAQVVGIIPDVILGNFYSLDIKLRDDNGVVTHFTKSNDSRLSHFVTEQLDPHWSYKQYNQNITSASVNIRYNDDLILHMKQNTDGSFAPLTIMLRAGDPVDRFSVIVCGAYGSDSAVGSSYFHTISVVDFDTELASTLDTSLISPSSISPPRRLTFVKQKYRTWTILEDRSH